MDHLLQEAYIRVIAENEEFWLFYNDYGKFKWQPTHNYENHIFSYDKNKSNSLPFNLNEINPELGGIKNPLFSKLENSSSSVLTDNFSSDPVENRKIVEDKINYGYRLLEPEAAAALKINSDQSYTFDDVYNGLVRISKLNMDNLSLKSGHIKFDKKYCIISDNPVIFNQSSMWYSINNSNIFYANSDLKNNIMRDYLCESAYNWIHLCCQRANQFLIGHKSLSLDIRNAIQQSYEQGIYKFGFDKLKLDKIKE